MLNAILARTVWSDMWIASNVSPLPAVVANAKIEEFTPEDPAPHFTVLTFEALFVISSSCQNLWKWSGIWCLLNQSNGVFIVPIITGLLLVGNCPKWVTTHEFCNFALKKDCYFPGSFSSLWKNLFTFVFYVRIDFFYFLKRFFHSYLMVKAHA